MADDDDKAGGKGKRATSTRAGTAKPSKRRKTKKSKKR
jgi:hypothetical protein